MYFCVVAHSFYAAREGVFSFCSESKKPEGNQSKHFPYSKSTTFNMYSASQALNLVLWTVNTSWLKLSIDFTHWHTTLYYLRYSCVCLMPTKPKLILFVKQPFKFEKQNGFSVFCQTLTSSESLHTSCAR